MRDQAARLLGAGAGHRLVEQEELGRLGERDCQLQPALLAVRERAGRRVRPGLQVDDGQRLQGGRVERRLARDRLPETEARAGARLHGQRDVLQRREARQHVRDLEGARQPQMGAGGHRQMRDVATVEDDAAGVGGERAGDLVDERGLAGAVGADDGVRLAGQNVEVDAVGDLQRAERLGEVLQAQHRRAHRRLQRATARAMPRSADSRSAVSRRPSAICNGFERLSAAAAACLARYRQPIEPLPQRRAPVAPALGAIGKHLSRNAMRRR